MLVLSRKRNEKITLTVDGKEVELTVVRIDNNKVRIGFEADLDVQILRTELISENIKNAIA